MSEWKDISTNFNGKMLRKVVHVSDTEIVEASLYYTHEAEDYTNQYGAKERRILDTHCVVFNASFMRASSVSGMFSGGPGKSYEMTKGNKRQTIKGLWDIANKLDDATIIASAQGDAEPTLIVGRK